MRARLRMLVAILVAALATPAVLLASAGTSAASAPARVEGVLPSCVTNASGTDTMTFVSPLSGVAVFFGQSPVAVTGVTGGTTPERILSAEYRTTQAGTTHIVSVTGPPSTPCTVFYAVDETPANDDVTAPEVLSGTAGTVRGSTRAANNPFGDPRPTPGAQRVVWYEWSGPTGTATITAEPLPGGGITSAANGATSTGVAVYDAADLSAPLQVGGDGIAYQEDGGSGGSVTLPVVSGTDYLVAVFSAGGTGIFANQFGYLAAGAFDLTYDVPAAPVAQDDVAHTTSSTPVTIDVLANDVDPDGGPLEITDVQVLNSPNSVAEVDPADPTKVVFTPGFDAGNYEYFTYEIEDDDGGTDQALVSVFVDVAIPSSAIEVSPSLVDFGAVPLGKTADVDVTITNTGSASVSLGIDVEQAAPSPFDATNPGVECLLSPLAPGYSCVVTVRYWSIAGANAASPATLFLRGASSDPVAAVPLFASSAPAVPPGTPNAAPIAVDDVVLGRAGFEQPLEALYNDIDPDDDQLTITGATGAQHGTLGGVVPCIDFHSGFNPEQTCVRYTPDPAFVGIDQITYTVADDRGLTDTGTIYVAVGTATTQPNPRVDSVTPGRGPEAGGPTITIDGANFVPSAIVILQCTGSQYAYPDSTFVSTTRLTFTAPALPAGAVCDVFVAVQSFGLGGVLTGGYTVDGGALPTVVPGGGSVLERNSGSPTMNVGVSLSAPSTQPVTVEWETLELSGDGIADGSSDYTPAGGVVTFAPGETVKTVPVAVTGDTRDEPNELVFVSWKNPLNAVIGGFYGLGYGTIRDDDPPPSVQPGSTSVVEGDSGTTVLNIPVSLSAASGRTVTVDWATTPVSGIPSYASTPADYATASGVVVFAPGETLKTVSIVVSGDLLDEPDEFVVTSFRNPTNATIGGFYGLGYGSIEDDD